MLNLIKRSRRSPVAKPTGSLGIGNLLDHPALRAAMGLDDEPGQPAAASGLIELEPMVALHFGAARELEHAI